DIDMHIIELIFILSRSFLGALTGRELTVLGQQSNNYKDLLELNRQLRKLGQSHLQNDLLLFHRLGVRVGAVLGLSIPFQCCLGY
uniref:hypothetical protein n=1 Tax=Mesorhizobium sp. GbtcB19 TaxID=2824764 RepID=UPI001C30FF29